MRRESEVNLKGGIEAATGGSGDGRGHGVEGAILSAIVSVPSQLWFSPEHYLHHACNRTSEGLLRGVHTDKLEGTS
jgi:hypothetical protein